MDYEKEKSMIVHLDQRKVIFSQIPGDLYACSPKLNENEQQDTSKTIDQSYLTVKENSKFISNRQLKKAQGVKQLQNALRMLSHAALKAIITVNMIQ